VLFTGDFRGSTKYRVRDRDLNRSLSGKTIFDNVIVFDKHYTDIFVRRIRRSFEEWLRKFNALGPDSNIVRHFFFRVLCQHSTVDVGQRNFSKQVNIVYIYININILLLLLLLFVLLCTSKENKLMIRLTNDF